MTSTELKDEIDLAITSETSPASITPTDVGNTLKLMVDYVDQEINNLPIDTELKIFRAKLTKTGTGGSASFSLNILKNETGKTIVCNNSGGVNAVLNSSDTSNFLTGNSMVRITDNNYLNTVIVKHSIDSLNQVSIYSYFNDSININFSDNLDIEFLIYP